MNRILALMLVVLMAAVPATLAQSKALMRRLIQHYLGGQVLQSRRVFTELFAYPGDPS